MAGSNAYAQHGAMERKHEGLRNLLLRQATDVRGVAGDRKGVYVVQGSYMQWNNFAEMIQCHLATSLKQPLAAKPSLMIAPPECLHTDTTAPFSLESPPRPWRTLPLYSPDEILEDSYSKPGRTSRGIISSGTPPPTTWCRLAGVQGALDTRTPAWLS